MEHCKGTSHYVCPCRMIFACTSVNFGTLFLNFFHGCLPWHISRKTCRPETHRWCVPVPLLTCTLVHCKHFYCLGITVLINTAFLIETSIEISLWIHLYTTYIINRKIANSETLERNYKPTDFRWSFILNSVFANDVVAYMGKGQGSYKGGFWQSFRESTGYSWKQILKYCSKFASS